RGKKPRSPHAQTCFAGPCVTVLLHYGGAVNPNLTSPRWPRRTRPAPLPLPAAGPNKGVLTIYGSGRATFGHPADRKDRSLTRDGRGFRGTIWSRRIGAAPTDQRSRCSCGHRRCRGRHVPYTIRSGLCSQTREPESNIVSQEPAAALASAAASHGPKVMLRPRVETSTDRCQATM